ncbi:MAG TPA: HAMP domain-containing sensor histidine kinase, partial [Ignavibacteriales bacterium]|nr:HAMP domain-containing sensor histidine kinase [Ignavibacteriales bacterium]
ESKLLDSLYIMDIKAGLPISEFNYYYVNESDFTDVPVPMPLSPTTPGLFCRVRNNNHRGMFPNIVYENYSLLIVPAGESGTKYLLLRLNKEYLKENVLKKELKKIFPENSGFQYVIAIVSSDYKKLLFATDTAFDFSRPNWYDAKMPIGLLPPSDSPDRDSAFASRVRFIRKLDKNHEMHPKGNKMEFDSLMKTSYLLAGLKSGPLNGEIDAIRIKNLAISFSILIILALASGLIIVITAGARRLAQRRMQFVAYLPHELRTPLTVIKTASENLSDGLINDPDKSRRYGRIIKSEADKLWDMIENSLMFAGIQSDKKKFVFREVDICPVIAKALDSIDKKDIDIRINTATDLPCIYGDEAALASAFGNIISNAVKFNRPEGWVDISAEFNKRKKLVSITVRDNGRGIPPGEIGRIFEPFYRSREVLEDNIPGNGIGLSLTESIIKMHGGSIHAVSKPGTGSAFIINLPVIANGYKDFIG